MLINRDSKTWIVVSLLILIAATAVYVPYAEKSLAGPSGGSLTGLVYGSVGFAMMLFALALGLRKRVRTMRIGRAYWWMQGHIWLGLLAYPIILFHAGFRWGGPMTQILMWLFTIVVVSGIFGLYLQQVMPTKLLRDVQYETIYEQVDRVVTQLQDEAAAMVTSASEKLEGAAFDMEVVPAGAATATLPAVANSGAKTLVEFYEKEVKPFLAVKIPPTSKLADEQGSRVMFNRLKEMLPAALTEPLADLQQIVEERRQLARQKRLHHWLHGWLIVHVPLSYGLMILAAYHAVYAVRYTGVKW